MLKKSHFKNVRFIVASIAIGDGPSFGRRPIFAYGSTGLFNYRVVDDELRIKKLNVYFISLNVKADNVTC